MASLAVAPARAAGGVNLSWDDCGTFGALQRDFACDVNTGVHTLYGSAVAPAAMPQLNGHAAVIDLVTNQPTLSSWWQMVPVSCRQPTFGSPSPIIGDFNFLADTHCLDPWLGAAQGGLNYAVGANGPNRARIRTVCGIPGSVSINATDEYYVFKVYISNMRTTGAGSCAGCTDGACLVFRSLKLTQPLGVGDYVLTEQPLSRFYAQWQAGAANVVGGCPQATPARAATWGTLKSLYR